MVYGDNFNEEDIVDQQCDYCGRVDGHDPDCLYGDDLDEEEEEDQDE
jgi:hypothetical protein